MCEILPKKRLENTKISNTNKIIKINIKFKTTWKTKKHFTAKIQDTLRVQISKTSLVVVSLEESQLFERNTQNTTSPVIFGI